MIFAFFSKKKFPPEDSLPKTTICPRSSDPYYIVTYYIKWVTLLRHTVFFLSFSAYCLDNLVMGMGGEGVLNLNKKSQQQNFTE